MVTTLSAYLAPSIYLYHSRALYQKPLSNKINLSWERQGQKWVVLYFRQMQNYTWNKEMKHGADV